MLLLLLSNLREYRRQRVQASNCLIWGTGVSRVDSRPPQPNSGDEGKYKANRYQRMKNNFQTSHIDFVENSRETWETYQFALRPHSGRVVHGNRGDFVKRLACRLPRKFSLVGRIQGSQPAVRSEPLSVTAKTSDAPESSSRPGYKIIKPGRVLFRPGPVSLCL